MADFATPTVPELRLHLDAAKVLLGEDRVAQLPREPGARGRPPAFCVGCRA